MKSLFSQEDMKRDAIESRKSFLSLLQRPARYHFEVQRSGIVSSKQPHASGKRKYSAEMREKATVREKNRIKLLGVEFHKLAELLPQAPTGKRSHQKILQDTIAYTVAMEVELGITDESRLQNLCIVTDLIAAEEGTGKLAAAESYLDESHPERDSDDISIESEATNPFVYLNQGEKHPHSTTTEKFCFENAVSGFHFKL